MKVSIVDNNKEVAPLALVDMEGNDILLNYLIDTDLDSNLIRDVFVTSMTGYVEIKDILEKEQELIYRIDELKKIHGSEEVYQVVESVIYDGYLDHADKVNDALDVAFTELD